MRKISLTLLLVVFVWTSCFSKDSLTIHIVPEPVAITEQQGTFLLDEHTAIVASDPAAASIAKMLSGMLQAPTGFALPVVQKKQAHGIFLQINKTPETALGDAGYTFTSDNNQIVIAANKPRGLFYGIQTLLQLLPPDVESRTRRQGVQWTVPAVHIKDYPRFGWRGLMLDVSRHFFSVDFIKSYLDEMAKYKFNVFHWHLTDDQGWRIEIKGLPRLTEVGAWRVPRTGRWGTFDPPQPGEKATYGGYYTQEEIKEVIAYAKKRFITIVPEIDVPAHSLSLIAAYPNLSCTQEQYPVNPGSNFYKKQDNVLCVANDSTWLMLDKIFTQIAQLFPGEYIHVGGDEAYKGFWENCPKDQALMKKEGITSLEGLQSYFVKKLERLIISKGKKMIGWDEILEGGLAPEATVMSWRGMKGGIKAAQMHHPVVMTPTTHAYIDLYQGDPLIEPSTYSKLRLTACYHFDPVPEGVDAQYILGGQGNLWTESIPNTRHAEYMTWPRAMALAEVFWSPKSQMNWPDFIRRMEGRFKYMDVAGVKYARSTYDPIISGVRGADSTLKVKLTTEIPGLALYYTFDGTNPDQYYSRYEGEPLDIPKGASEIRVITYRNGKPIGHQINCPVDGYDPARPYTAKQKQDMATGYSVWVVYCSGVFFRAHAPPF